MNVRLCKKALQRALALVDELGAGKVISGIDIYPNEQPLPTIRTDVKVRQTLMGIEVPAEKMVEILEKLGIKTIAGAITCSARARSGVRIFSAARTLPKRCYASTATTTFPQAHGGRDGQRPQQCASEARRAAAPLSVRHGRV